MVIENKITKFKLDDGVYQELRQSGQSLNDYLGARESQEGITFTGRLAELTPFQRQLMAYEMPVMNANFTVEEIYKTNSDFSCIIS